MVSTFLLQPKENCFLGANSGVSAIRAGTYWQASWVCGKMSPSRFSETHGPVGFPTVGGYSSQEQNFPDQVDGLTLQACLILFFHIFKGIFLNGSYIVQASSEQILSIPSPFSDDIGSFQCHLPCRDFRDACDQRNKDSLPPHQMAQTIFKDF